MRLRDQDIETYVAKDSGPGGQHRNKTESCVVMRHTKTGITAKAAGKCQHRNRVDARALLEARVAQDIAARAVDTYNAIRRQQVGSGQRADKVRTYRVQDDMVTDHRTGRKTRLSRVLAGEIYGLLGR